MTSELMTANNNLNHEAILWSCKYLSSHGYTLRSSLPENVQNTPWSYVARFATTIGYVYLKRTPKLIALEATVNQILRNQFHAVVPEIIAQNAELNCFLMKDAGKPLRQFLKKQFDKKQFDARLLCKAINQFTALQLAIADRFDVLLDIGVPDWQLAKLPELYLQLLTKKDLLIADGVSEVEINVLKNQFPTISDLCEKLSDYSVKPTLVQPDFHDNNLLIDDAENITIIDLGEIVISHPFFSLLNCLHQAQKHHGLKDTDTAYQQLMDACLENYMRYENKNRLLDAFAIAQTLLPVYGALANVRLIDACGQEQLMSFQPGKLGGELKKVITALA